MHHVGILQRTRSTTYYHGIYVYDSIFLCTAKYVYNGVRHEFQMTNNSLYQQHDIQSDYQIVWLFPDSRGRLPLLSSTQQKWDLPLSTQLQSSFGKVAIGRERISYLKYIMTQCVKEIVCDNANRISQWALADCSTRMMESAQASRVNIYWCIKCRTWLIHHLQHQKLRYLIVHCWNMIQDLHGHSKTLDCSKWNLSLHTPAFQQGTGGAQITLLLPEGNNL